MPSLLRTPTPPFRPRILRALALVSATLLAHAAMIGLVALSSTLTPPPEKRITKPTMAASMKRIDSRTWAANRGAAARTAAPLERPVTIPKGQIVDVQQGNNQVPTESKYIAESNNTVKKETKAREQTNKWSVAKANNSANPQHAPQAKGVTPQSSAPPPSGIDLTQSMLGTRKPPPTLFPTSLPVTGSASETDSHGPVGTDTGTPQSGGDTQEGGGAPNDALDVPVGDGTYLNTREWQFASFFNRVKQAVSARWQPNERLRTRNRSLGALSRTTVINVVLRDDGSIADLFVSKSSGIDELDVEAMNAFHKAAPFSNPPAALLRDGVIAFSFSFNVSDQGLAIPIPRGFR